MGAARVLLVWAIALGWLSGCSDTTRFPKDAAADSIKVDAGVDAVTDAMPPGPDAPADSMVTPDVGDEDGLVADSQLRNRATCATAAPITLTAGRATIHGDTTGAADEYGAAVGCSDRSHRLTLGPQVYYELTPAAGKMYKVTVVPTFDAFVYWFRKSSCGASAAIDSDCSSSGVTGNRAPPPSGSGQQVVYITPQTGAVIIAIDSTDPTEQGTFTLEIEEMTPPTNGTCSTATPITLTAGKATINGTTNGTANQFSMSCGPMGATSGPNAYYELTPKPGKTYQITLKQAFPEAFLYWFRKASCPTTTAIEADCSSWGVNGGWTDPYGYDRGRLLITGAGAPIIIAVDGKVPHSGDFVVEIEEGTLQANDTCASATPLTLVNGAATVTGDTSSWATRTFGPYCGVYSQGSGPDLFYSLPVVAGALYEVSVTPATGSLLSPVLQILDGCGLNDLGCAHTPSAPSKLLLAATAAMSSVIIVVDSAGWSAGSFTLDVKTLPPAP